MDCFSFAVIGHIDTGKSTLCGHILVKTGGISSDEFMAIKRRTEKDNAKYALYARVLDIFEDEMIKSKTHEWSQFEFSFRGCKYRLIDTPGHKGFIRSMIEGISSSATNVAVLILSAKEGEFESSFTKSGQTKEDLILARATGIAHLIVVINKMDLCDWNIDKFNSIKNQIDVFVKQLQFEKVFYLPVSGYTGEGILDGCPEWYKGKPLLETLEELATTQELHTKTDDVDTTVFNTTAIKGTFKVLAEKVLITSGWKGIAHIQGHEYSVETRLNGFIKQGDRKEITLLFDFPISISKGTRIIIRNADKTIGFGKVNLIKH